MVIICFITIKIILNYDFRNVGDFNVFKEIVITCTKLKIYNLFII